MSFKYKKLAGIQTTSNKRTNPYVINFSRIPKLCKLYRILQSKIVSLAPDYSFDYICCPMKDTSDSLTPTRISFYWRFDADNGRGKELRAEAPNPAGGWPLWFEYEQGWYVLGTNRLAPQWVADAWQKAKPSLINWKPQGYTGREGYWVGKDDQKSERVEVLI